jgi:hypothetical protein
MALKTTSDADLQRIAKKLGIRNLKIFSIDNLPLKASPGFYIVNADHSSGPGTHWVSAFIDKTQTVYFDPFGMPPDKRMWAFLRRSGNKPIAVTTQAQDVDASSCGYWCLFFLNTMRRGGTVGYFLSMLDCCDQEKNEDFLERYFSKVK